MQLTPNRNTENQYMFLPIPISVSTRSVGRADRTKCKGGGQRRKDPGSEDKTDNRRQESNSLLLRTAPSNRYLGDSESKKKSMKSRARLETRDKTGKQRTRTGEALAQGESEDTEKNWYY